MLRHFPRPMSRLYPTGLTLLLAASSVLFDLVPSIKTNLSLQWGHGAVAQTLSSAELENYASAVLVIEPLRQAAYEEIRSILGSNSVPSIACHRPETIDRLDSNIRSIARNYCDRAIRVVQQNDLSIERFNAITQMMTDRDSPLYDQLQDTLLDLQQN